jgi:hypothetical protein
MSDNILNEAASALQQEWDIALSEIISEAAILHALEQAVIAQLQRGPEAFFQLMYRLDISEQKVNAALNSNEAAAIIARLIYDRQLQKIRSRIQNPPQRSIEDDELNW